MLFEIKRQFLPCLEPPMLGDFGDLKKKAITASELVTYVNIYLVFL